MPIENNAALIIIDMQKGMLPTSDYGKNHPSNNPQATDHIAALLAHWRNLKRPVIFVRHVSRSLNSPFAAGQIGVEFQEALRPLTHEFIVDKNVPDAFIHSSLERWLRVRDINCVVLVGVSTNISVENTARTASNLGFKTIVVEDATYAFDSRDDAGNIIPAKEVHRMALANLAAEYATVLRTKELI